MTEDIEKIISEVTAKDSHVLCSEVMSITDTMDVLRSKWTVEGAYCHRLREHPFQGYSGSRSWSQRKGVDRTAAANAG